MPKNNSGLRLLAHDGKNLKSDQSIGTRQLRSMKSKNLIEVSSENLPEVKDKFHKSLGKTEITSIAGVDKDDSAGWQGYFAYLKDGKVMEMGLPHVTRDGEDHFLPLEDITIGNLASMIEALPEGVELALVWRLDRDMTKDIEMKKNSVVYSIDSVNQPAKDSLDFGLLNEKRPLGCSGAMGDDITVEVAQVKLYCGEDDDPISMSLMSTAPPPESFYFDCFDDPNRFFQKPAVVQSPIPASLSRESNARDCCNNVADAHEQNGRIHTEDDPAANLLLKITLVKPKENGFVSSDQMDASPSTKPVTGDEAKRIIADTIVRNPIIQIIMNSGERRLWGKLHGVFVDAAPCRTPSVLRAPKQKTENPKPGPTFFAMKLPARECTYIPARDYSAHVKPVANAHTRIPQPSYKAQEERKPCASNIYIPRAPRLHFVAPRPGKQEPEKATKSKLVENPPKKKVKKCRKAVTKLAEKKKEAPKRVAPPQAAKPDKIKKKKSRKAPLRPAGNVTKTKNEGRLVKPKTAKRAINPDVPKAAKKRKAALCKTKPKSRKKKKPKKMHSHYKNEMLGLKAKRKRTKRRRTRARSS